MDNISFTTGTGFFRQIRIGYQRTPHRHHVAEVVDDHLTCRTRIIDAVAGNYRNIHQFLNSFCQVAEHAARYRSHNLRDPGFVPAHINIEGVDPDLHQALGIRLQILASVTAGHEIIAVHANDQREIIPNFLADSRHDFQAKTHAVFKCSAIFILALIGQRGKKFTDQIPGAA